MLLAVSKQFPTYTFVIKNQPICYFGIVPMWEGVAECWMVPGELIAKYPVAFYKASKLVFEEFIDYYKLERLQMTCAVINEMSFNWLKRMGFKEEGVFKKYAKGQDFYIMAKVI